jgi:Iap family predicted aminopeptidase
MYMSIMAFRKEFREFLHSEGALVLLSDSDKPHGLLNMTGNWLGGDRVSALDPLPTLFIVHEHYAQLYRMATKANASRTRIEVEIRNKITPGPIPAFNTVGEITGSEKPDEVVVLGAHIDSWDLAQGTTDNGTGTCVVLEAARILSKCGVKPKRTIRFILFSGEEQGLYGSRDYVKKHEAEMPKFSMALVHDTGTGKVQGIGLQGRESCKAILEPELASLKEIGCTDINTRGMPGSDHMSFESAGVPGFAVQQDWAEYRFTHHSQSDTLDKAKEADLIQGAQVMAVAAMRVANLPKLLPHDKPPRKSMFDSSPEKPVPAAKPGEKPAASAPAKEPATTKSDPAKPVPVKPAQPKAPGNT